MNTRSVLFVTHCVFSSQQNERNKLVSKYFLRSLNTLQETNMGGYSMDTKNKESKGSAATASKAAASKKQDEAPSPGQGATSSQNQGNGGQDLMQDAKQTASEVVNQVQQRAGDEINRQKDTAASELSTVVNAVRRFGESLNN